MFPLVPVFVASGSSALAAVAGWGFLKYEELKGEMKSIQSIHAQASASVNSAREGSLWRELLEPVAKRWGGALKCMAYAIVAASGALIVIGIGAWFEIRRLRFQNQFIKDLELEIQHLRAQLADKERQLKDLSAKDSRGGTV